MGRILSGALVRNSFYEFEIQIGIVRRRRRVCSRSGKDAAKRCLGGMAALHRRHIGILLPGHVCTVDARIVGFCFGARETGEIEVVAVLPGFENRGIGRELLDRTSKELAKHGHTRLFLGCSPDPASRSYGFYRRLGWRSTGTFDQYGDEILEIFVEPYSLR